MRVSPGAPGNFQTSSGDPSEIDLVKVGGSSISLGQTTMSASFPVVLASDQSPVPVSQSGSWSVTVSGTVTVTGTVAATQSGTWNVSTLSTITNVVHVDDNSSTLSIDDGGGSITIDGSVSISGSVDTELTTADLDTGAGTDTRAVVGLVLAASGGGLLVGTANPMPISDNSSSITVDNGGTFAVQAAQSGTWNIGTLTTITNVVHVDDNSSTLSIDDGGGSITIDGSITADTELPAAATLADDTSNPSTVSVGALALLWDPNDSNWDRVRAVNATLNAAAADSGIQAAGLTAQFDDSSPTSITENQWGNLRISTRRELYVQIRDAAGNERGLNIDANGGIPITIESSQTLATVTTVSTVSALGNGTTGPQKAEDAASANSDVGIPAMAIRKATPGNTSDTDGDYEMLQISAGRLWTSAVIDTALPASTNTIGDVDVAPRTTGGWSVGNFTSGDTYTALTNSAQVIKGSAGKFGGYYIYNPNNTAVYVMVYNIAAASVTVGTSTAKLVFCIPASGGANLELLAGIPFDTALSIAAATTGGGNSAPTTALEAMIFYK